MDEKTRQDLLDLVAQLRQATQDLRELRRQESTPLTRIVGRGEAFVEGGVRAFGEVERTILQYLDEVKSKGFEEASFKTVNLVQIIGDVYGDVAIAGRDLLDSGGKQ